MLKRKAESSQREIGLFTDVRRISKKAKVPATNTVHCILEHCGADAPEHVEVTDHCDQPFSTVIKRLNFSGESCPKSPFELKNNEPVKRGKNWISLPIQLGNQQRLSPSWFPARSTSSNVNDGSYAFEYDVYRSFQRRTRNFENVDIKLCDSDSSDVLDLNLKMGQAFPTDLADHIFFRLENEVQYFSGKLAKSKLPFLGLSLKLPRSHVAHGDVGLIFSFDGNTVPAKPFTPLIRELKNIISQIVGVDFNYVLIHRFKNGNQHLHEFKNPDEIFGDADIDSSTAMMCFGSSRQLNLHRMDVPRKRGSNFTFRHGFILSMNAMGFVSFMHSFPPLKNVTTPTVVLHFIKKLPLSYVPV